MFLIVTCQIYRDVYDKMLEPNLNWILKHEFGWSVSTRSVVFSFDLQLFAPQFCVTLYTPILSGASNLSTVIWKSSHYWPCWILERIEGRSSSLPTTNSPLQMALDPPLSPGVGYGIVLGLGFAFAFGMILTTWVLKRYQNEVQTSEMFSTAGRTVKTGLFSLLGSPTAMVSQGLFGMPQGQRCRSFCLQRLQLSWSGRRRMRIRFLKSLGRDMACTHISSLLSLAWWPTSSWRPCYSLADLPW